MLLLVPSSHLISDMFYYIQLKTSTNLLEPTPHFLGYFCHFLWPWHVRDFQYHVILYLFLSCFRYIFDESIGHKTWVWVWREVPSLITLTQGKHPGLSTNLLPEDRVSHTMLWWNSAFAGIITLAVFWKNMLTIWEVFRRLDSSYKRHRLRLVVTPET